MAGGGNRHAGAAVEPRIGTGNVFAVLETLKKKKKKPATDNKTGAKGGSRVAKGQEPPAPKPEVFWVPAPLTTKSWADVEDDDDDDYFFSTTAPPPRPIWGDDDAAKEEEIESEDDGLDEEVDDNAEDDREHEHEADDDVPAKPTVKNVVAPTLPSKDTQRQLSKKELKKKELAELDVVLAELGLGVSSNSNQHRKKGKKGIDQAAGEKNEDAPASLETKSSKKKKSKKVKSSKEPKEAEDQADGLEEAADAEPDENITVDAKEHVKKVASMKKKKSNKETGTTAKIVASEAAARRARLAGAKKKAKNHYNQHPML